MIAIKETLQEIDNQIYLLNENILLINVEIKKRKFNGFSVAELIVEKEKIEFRILQFENNNKNYLL